MPGQLHRTADVTCCTAQRPCRKGRIGCCLRCPPPGLRCDAAAPASGLTVLCHVPQLVQKRLRPGREQLERHLHAVLASDMAPTSVALPVQRVRELSDVVVCARWQCPARVGRCGGTTLSRNTIIIPTSPLCSQESPSSGSCGYILSGNDLRCRAAGGTRRVPQATTSTSDHSWEVGFRAVMPVSDRNISSRVSESRAHSDLGPP